MVINYVLHSELIVVQRTLTFFQGCAYQGMPRLIGEYCLLRHRKSVKIPVSVLWMFEQSVHMYSQGTKENPQCQISPDVFVRFQENLLRFN